MSIFGKFEKQGRERGQRRLRPRLQRRRPAGGDRGPAAEGAGRRGQADVPGQAAGAQRVRRRPVRARLRQAHPVQQDADRRARRRAEDPRARHGVRVQRTDPDPLRPEHRRCPTGRFTVASEAVDGHERPPPASASPTPPASATLGILGSSPPVGSLSPVGSIGVLRSVRLLRARVLGPPSRPGPPRAPRNSSTAPPPAGPSWCWRSTACATRSPRPGSSSAGAPMPTCGSTTRASPGCTRRSRCTRPATLRRRDPRPGLDQRHHRQRPQGAAGARSPKAPGSRSAPPGCWCTRPPGAEGTDLPMSELAVTAIKVLYLALLWLFILSVVSVIRSDLFGRTVPTPVPVDDQPQPLEEPAPAKKSRRGKKGQPAQADHRAGPADRAVGQPGRRRGDDRPRLGLPADPGRRLRLHPARPPGRRRSGPVRRGPRARPTARTSTASGSPLRPASPWSTPSGSARRS